MKLSELVPWLEAGHGVDGIPRTDVSKCPRGLLINITDLTAAQALKTARGLMPEYAELTVVKIGDPIPEPLKEKVVEVPPMTIEEATSPTSGTENTELDEDFEDLEEASLIDFVESEDGDLPTEGYGPEYEDVEDAE